jgi:hypothetical protein
MKNGDIATTLNCPLHLYKVKSQIANKERGWNTPTPRNKGCMHCLMLILSKYNIHKSHKQVFINDPYGYGFKFQDFIGVIFNY